MAHPYDGRITGVENSADLRDLTLPDTATVAKRNAAAVYKPTRAQPGEPIGDTELLLRIAEVSDMRRESFIVR